MQVCIYLCMCMSMLVFFSFFHFAGQYLMDDSDFQVVLVLISFVIFQNRKKCSFCTYPKVSVSVSKFETKLVSVSVSNFETKITKSQSQSQILRLKSKVSVSVSKTDTIIKSLSLSLNFWDWVHKVSVSVSI